MKFIDLKIFARMCQSPASMKEEIVHEFRENNLCATDGICPRIRVSKMCRSVQWQFQNPDGHLKIPHLCMAFAQLTYRENLRDIEACLRATQSKLYHLGIRGKASRNTLAHANQTRDWRIYADFAQILITRARKLYTEESFGIKLDQAVYALDSTTIDLCLALFPWAEFRKRKGAIKLHTLLDLRGNIPSVVIITTGKVHDVNILDNLIIEAGAIYVMDRGYLDFARLYKIHQNLGTVNSFV